MVSLKKPALVLLSVFVVFAVAASSYGDPRFGVYEGGRPAGPKFVPGEVIVKFKPGVGEVTTGAVHRRHGTVEFYRSALAGFRLARVPQGKTVAQVVAALRQEASVEYAEPNYIATALLTPNDPFYIYQWHMDNPDYGGIHTEAAWDIQTGNAGVVVAVVDTGVAYKNYGKGRDRYYRAPDLANTVFVPGYDFVENDAFPGDDNSHGTHVAGTIAQSTNNGIGVAGVAFKTAIMPVKVLNKNGSGAYAWIADGIIWAADNGASVINLSLGGPNGSETLENAVAYAYNMGVTVIAAAGNAEEGSDPSDRVIYPAAYDAYVIAVGATRYDEAVADYSFYYTNTTDSVIREYVDLTAPGGDLSVDQNGDGYPDGVLQNTFNPNSKNRRDFGYWFFDGTSMATPHVSGVAALLCAQGITSPDEIRNILQSTAEDKDDPGWDAQYGHGIVDASAALTYFVSPNSPPVAYDDSATTDEDTPVTIDVLANDTDGDGDTLTVTNLTQPSNGTATINGDQTVTYIPDPDFSGSGSFTYTANDGKVDSNTATVTVTIDAVSDAPVANDDSATTQVDTALAINVLANDTDADDGDALTVTNLTQPSNGTATLNELDQTVTYTPNADFNGTDSFTYTANDGVLDSNVATVTVTVTTAPTGPTAHVTIDMTKKVSKKGWQVTATVYIRDTDASGALIEGATVSGTWNGDHTGDVSGNTDRKGKVRFKTPSLQEPGTVTFTVLKVVKNGTEYELSGETSDTISNGTAARHPSWGS